MSAASKNFDASEFACRCGCGFDSIRAELVYGLQCLRDALGMPIVITSGCRCAQHNLVVGGAANSQHVLGYAADIQVHGITSDALARAAEQVPELRAGGIGIYDSWVHVDVRGHRARWDKR